MPSKLSTTVSKITTIPNPVNSMLITEFHKFLETSGASERLVAGPCSGTIYQAVAAGQTTATATLYYQTDKALLSNASFFRIPGFHPFEFTHLAFYLLSTESKLRILEKRNAMIIGILVLISIFTSLMIAKAIAPIEEHLLCIYLKGKILSPGSKDIS